MHDWILITDFLFFFQNDSDGDSSSHVGFLCGSPPIRANNPVIHDPQFGKRLPSFSPLGGSSYGKMPAVRVEVGSPSCGVSSSPKVRIEGFACGNSETHYAVTFVWAFRWYVPDFALRPTDRSLWITVVVCRILSSAFKLAWLELPFALLTGNRNCTIAVSSEMYISEVPAYLPYDVCV